MEKSTLHKRVMRQVYFVFWLQRLFSPRMMKLGFFSFSVIGLASLVSVGNVIANMPTNDLAQFFTFTTYAFTHTTAAVQVLSVAAACALLWYARDLLRHTPRVAFS